MTRLAIPAVIGMVVVMLGIHRARRRGYSEPDPYAEPVPMTWPLPDGYTATYRYTTGPTGVPSSLN